VLAEAGYEPAEIDELVNSGAARVAGEATAEPGST